MGRSVPGVAARTTTRSSAMNASFARHPSVVSAGIKTIPVTSREKVTAHPAENAFMIVRNA